MNAPVDTSIAKTAHTMGASPARAGGHSIRTKLVAGITIIIVVLVCALTFVIARNAASLLERELRAQLSQLLDQSTEVLESFLRVQETNLDLWTTEPLISSVANDPGLAAVFLPGLKSYFNNYTDQDPSIKNIYLIVNGSVTYTHSVPAMLNAANTELLLRLPPDKLEAILLDSQKDGGALGVIAIKHQLRQNEQPIDGAFIVLLLDLQVVQNALLGSVRPGENGFLALVSRLAGAERGLWIPKEPSATSETEGATGAAPEPIEVTSMPAWEDFRAVAAEGRLLTGIPIEFRSVILDSRGLDGTPLAIVGVASLQDLRQPIWTLVYFTVGFGALALLIGVLAALIFARNLTAPLNKLTDSMLKLAGGNLREPLPQASGTTDIDRMTEALSVFRDTAIEIEENNLREVATARQRLIDAIESISEGFAFFDADDRLELCNSRYRELSHDPDGERIKFGMTFEEISRSVVDSGIVHTDDPDAYVTKRVAQHRSPGPPILRHFDDGRWVQTSERATSGDGIVSVYTDLTELKNSEQRAANANLLIQESLRYGRRIQNAVLPDPENFARATDDHFLIWEPRDVVGGDFFWFHELDDGYMLVVGDCTGHGAPGAFLTLITCSILDRLLESGMGNDPSRLLNALHRNFRTLLGQDQENSGTNDGLETCVCVVNETKHQMTFAGAHLSLFCARDGHIEEIKGVKAGIGYGRYPPDTVYTSKVIDISGRPSFYIATDGMTDQVGGPKNRMFGKKRFVNILAENQGKPMTEQAKALNEARIAYRGGSEQRDDVTILGFTP